MPDIPQELIDNLSNPMWRVCNLYKIMIKGEDGEQDLALDFTPNRAQRRLIERLHSRNLILKARQLGFCLDPSTRVLTADLRWVQISELSPGDEVVAVDEHVPGGRGKARKMRTANVQAVVTVQRQAYRISFDDGRSVVCTGQHPWLSSKVATDASWRSIESKTKKKLTIGTWVRWVTKPWDEATAEDGWFGGMLDGEGCIAKRNTSASINVSQRCGPVWDRLVRYADERGYHACIENDAAERKHKYGKIPVPKLVFGRMDEQFRLIGQTRPTRFMENRFWEGRELPGKRSGDVGWAKIVSIEPLGEQTMIDLQTSTGTYIAEGFVSHNTTLVAILWLDTALFNENMRCGIVAQDKGAAEVIFRDKVKYAYDHIGERFGITEILHAMFPLERDSASELVFGHNNSSVRVATSMRSGTIHRLHVSEFGKICAKYPDKAKEVVTGSLPAVPQSGITIIESTAEGQDGEFFKMVQRALAFEQQGKPLTARDYKLHFFPWWAEESYRLDTPVELTEKDRKYFHELEGKIGRTLTDEQKWWYVAVRDADFSGDESKMWQEYPGTPEEAFQVSTEGCYYATQLAAARKHGRICRVPRVDVPTDTFWDVGRSDSTAIWFLQQVGLEYRWILHYEASGETLGHYWKYLQDSGLIFGHHYLPHDCAHKRLSDSNKSIEQMLGDLGMQNIVIVDRILDEQVGIQQTRKAFASCWFDETGCADGLRKLAGFKRRWNKSMGAWGTEPEENGCEHSADAFRQFGQALESGQYLGNRPARKTLVRRGSGLAR